MTEGWGTRRRVLQQGAAVAGGLLLGRAGLLGAQEALRPLTVACAGSIRGTLEGPVKEALAKRLGLALATHAGGADGVARDLVTGKVSADAFVPITAGPVEIVFRGGKADVAYPFARTELVLVYSPKSLFAGRFEAVAKGVEPWWSVLTAPGMRLSRSDPANDPSGRAIVFAVMLAAKVTGQPDLVQRTLGSIVNPEQTHPGLAVREALLSGAIDAAAGYRSAVEGGPLPFVRLPAEVNLAGPLGAEAAGVSFEVGGTTFRPEPLVFYAAALRDGTEDGARFVAWLQGVEAQELLRRNGYAVAGEAGVLRA